MEKSFKVVDGRQFKFILIDKRLIKDLSAIELQVYSILSSYSNNETKESWPSQQHMIDNFPITNRTLINGIQQLEVKKVIRVNRTNKHNIYKILQ